MSITNTLQTAVPETTSFDIMGMLKKRRSPMALTSLALFVITVLVAILWSPVYRSSATILIEQQEIPEELVRSTVTSFADQRIQVISQRVMTSSNLKKVIEKYNLYASERKRYPDEVIIEDMREDIVRKIISADVIDPRSGRATKATIAFGLAYENESPALAQKVANELSSLYLNENLKTRHAMAEETTRFLASEAQKLREQIDSVEQRLSIFKKDNFSKLPERTQMTLRQLNKAEQKLLDLNRRIELLGERKVLTQMELQKTDPMKDLLSEDGQPLLSAHGRMKVLYNRYMRLASVYSMEHPDVARTLREIDYLNLELGSSSGLQESHKMILQAERELAQLKQSYTSEHPSVVQSQQQLIELQKSLNQQLDEALRDVSNHNRSVDTGDDVIADNPIYLQLRAQLTTIDLEVASLESQKRAIAKKVVEYEDWLIDTPAVERQYRELLREHENASLKFREVKAKQMEAQLAQSLETAQKSERFTLIEPPLLPEKPIRPNRVAIFVVGILLSIVAGIALGYLLERLDKTVRGAQGVMDLVGVMPLATVPYIMTPQERQKKHQVKWKLLAVIGVVIVVVPLLVHIFYMPLDVLYYVAGRRMGWDV